MKKIFISHSSMDASIAEEFVQLLVRGIGVDEDLIFCSSCEGIDIPIGANFIEYIKTQLKEIEIVIPLVTKNYYGSIFSMYELGAAWVTSKTQLPIIVPPMSFEHLRDFLSTTISIKLNQAKDLNKLKDDLSGLIELKTVSTSRWEKERSRMIKSINAINTKPHEESTVTRLRTTCHSKYKVVVFDLDGTLLQGNGFKYSWERIWNYLGYDDSIRKKLFKKFTDNYTSNPQEYTYADWCKECGEYFKDRKLSRQDIRNIIGGKDRDGNDVKIFEEGKKPKTTKLYQVGGLMETLTILKSQNIITGVISGGVSTFYEYGISKISRDLIDIHYINRFIFDDKDLLEKIEPSPYDFMGKLKALEDICAKANCALEEAVFVGEGRNDKHIAQSSCCSIAFPADTCDDELKSICNHKIDKKNLCYILPRILIPNE